MSCYYEVKSRLRGVELLLDDLRNQITNSEEWLDDVIENCCQKEQIEDSFSDIEDKLKRTDRELSNTLSGLRG